MKVPLYKQHFMNEIHIYDDLGNEVIWKANKKYADEIINRCNLYPELIEALENLLSNHVSLVTSGDCGNWSVENEVEVILARELLKRAK